MLQQSKRSAMSFNEIVFEHKNKAYGAFELRRSLERHQFFAFVFSSSLFLIIVGGIYLKGLTSPIELIKLKDPLINDRVIEYYEDPNHAKAQEAPAKQESSNAGRNNLNKQDLVMVPVNDQIKTDEEKPVTLAPDSLAFNENGDGKPGEIIPDKGAGDGVGAGDGRDAGTNSDTDIRDVAEINPEFPGGLDNMYRYLSNNLRYPSYLRERRISGTVFVSFVVSNSGVINQVEILKSPDEGFNEEVIRVINKMPKWKPGFQAGKPVSVRYKMPLKFTLK